MGWKSWHKNHQSYKMYKPGNRISKTSWNGDSGIAKHRSLDEWWCLLMAGSRCRLHLYPLYKYATKHATLGGNDSRIGNNPFVVYIP